jgi:hypothetical protein
MIRRVVALSVAGVLAVTLGLAVSTQAATRTTSNGLDVELGASLGHVDILRPRGVADDGDGNGSAHPSRFGNRGGAGAIGAALPQNGIQYNGGPVIMSAKVVAVYWSNSTIFTAGPTPGTTGPATSDGSLVGYYLRNLGGSPYYNINTSYTNSSGTPIQNNVSYTGFWADNHNAPTGCANISDATMRSELNYGFTNGFIAYDPNTIYAIFTAGQVNLGGGFGNCSGSGFQYCAYHTYYNSTGNGVVKYAAMPYNNAYPGSCTAFQAGGPPNSDAGADAEVNTLSHEVEEANTDPQLNAWWVSNSSSSYYQDENADMCAWTFGTLNADGKGNITVGGRSFLVQRNWLNVASGGGCQQSYGATAPTTGTLSGKVTNAANSAAISGATVSISGGGSTTTDASGNYTIGNVTPGNNLSVTASKSGFTSSTLSANVTAGNTTTLNFSLTATAPTTGTLSGKVTNAAGGAGISGATVSISGGGSTTTDASGNYTINNVTPGNNLSVTASASGFTSSTLSASVTAGTTTTLNFSLTATSSSGVPGASSLSAASSGFTHGIKLTWTAAAPNGSNVTNYRVYRATASGGPFTLITTLGNVLTYTDTGNPSFRTSYYQVVAVNVNGAGPASNTASAFSF